MASSLPISPVTAAVPSKSNLPLRNIPGDYGLPLIGALKDRLDYFWLQGEEKFYQSRIEKYQSTVFRVNMPPGPTIAKDSRVICVLDQKSFPILFDVEKCEKKDIFTGTYMPDLSFTSGYRVCPYLDPSEDRHTKLKQWCFDVLAKNGRNFLPEFHKAIDESMVLWEKDIAGGKRGDVSGEVKQFAFNFLFRAICHHDPAAPGPGSLGRDGGPGASLWALPQLAPIAGQTGLPHVVEELAFHTVSLPSILVKGKYDAIHNFVKTYATEALDMAEASGIERNDAIANLVFFLGFNAYGGFNILFPEVVAFIQSAGKDLMHELHEEVKGAVTDGTVTLQALENMPLLKSVVYEVFRFKPPVPYQYARAKTDFIIENHENSFQIKKNELLYGFQPIVMHDPKVFDNPDEFVPRRFMGPEGQKLIKYVFWSNGPETEKSTVHNKQCAGKDLVVTMARAFVAEMFLRYKDYTLEIEGAGNAAKLFFTALTKA
uniref:Allene oxide synthase n=1 Tax=Pohlia nutans TaxID=140635 RepID=A0A4D6QKG8_9BRYO|nr:allene oxide synthase [Pohlia nutans]